MEAEMLENQARRSRRDDDVDEQITAVVRDTNAELDNIMRIAAEMRKLLEDEGGTSRDRAS
jgi:hypothetical protein